MKEQKPLKYLHSTPIQIRFNDIDKLGHTTNSVYQQYFDLGRMAYFTEVLKEQMNWEDEGLILVSINIDYLDPIKLYDQVEVHTKIYHIGNKSLKMAQEILNISTGKLAATSKAIMVGYNNIVESSIPVPVRWRSLIAAYEHDTLF